jgi:hypothetical protein
MQKIFIKTFPVYGGKYLLRKAVHNWVEKFSQDVCKSQMAHDHVALLKLCSGWKSSFELTGG